jgi:hypothetical protein
MTEHWLLTGGRNCCPAFEHVPRLQPPLAHACWLYISTLTLRSADPYKARTGYICDFGRENIVGHDQGARVSDFPILEILCLSEY